MPPLEKLPGHPEYKKPEHKLGKQELTKNTKLVLAEIQNMKPILEDYFRRMEAEEASKRKLELHNRKKLVQDQQQIQSRTTDDKESTLLINDRSVPQPISDNKGLQQRKAREDGFNKSRDIDGIVHNEVYPTNWDLINELKDVVSSSHPTDSFVHDRKGHDHHHHEHHVNYPGISYKNQSDGYIYPVSTSEDAPPLLPPKIKESPILPAKPNEYLYNISPKPSVTPMSEPRIKHSYEYPPEKPIKEEILEYSAFTEGGEGLRTMIMPANIYIKFIQIAASNTAKNLETCGVLCGRLSHNYFTVTSLVIPKQTSTSDTCSMTNEEELLEYVEESELLMLGWIHTHPTQTCFMSSMDLHTHSVYQLVLPEAVAIVCAPNKSPNFGIFRLTNPPGLQTVLQCERRGFHPHDCDEEIDKEISSHGHVVMKKVGLDIVDLR